MLSLLSITWDVPHGLDLGIITLRWYSLLFLLGFVLALQLIKKEFKHESMPQPWAEKLFIFIIVGTLLGARLGHVVFYQWDYYQKNILEILLPFRFQPEFEFTGFQGLASHGGAAGIAIAVFMFARRVKKKPPIYFFDRLATVVPLSGALVRMGNLMNSEIVGKPTDVPWAFVFKRLAYDPDTPRHPAQLYEALGYLTMFLILQHLYWRNDWGKRQGLLFGVFLIMLFGFRFMIEFVKAPQEDFEQNLAINMGQILSIPFILIGAYLALKSFKTKPA